MHLHHFAFLVREYDEAIEWFSAALGFRLVEDMDMGEDKRWVVMAPSSGGASLLLARAVGEEQLASVGNQFGGRVGLFLHVDDFDAAYDRLARSGILFAESPRAEAYGRVVVFFDLYGNKWDLIEPALSE